MEFVGPALPLSEADIAAAATELGIEAAVIRAVDEVESRGHGFLPDKRPVILFERHVFSRRTSHHYDVTRPHISSPTPGGYGASGVHQYDRLAEAITLDRKAALQSASWGRYQVMGFNAELCGWHDVEAFVASMQESEAEHLKAFIGYCRANDLVRFLATHDWRSFAAGYNGKGNVDDYSQKLAVAYRKHVAAAPSPMPNAISPLEKIKAIQLVLGVEQDGAFGPLSRAALNAVLGSAGQNTLRPASPRQK